jgi:hypothetical protein
MVKFGLLKSLLGRLLFFWQSVTFCPITMSWTNITASVDTTVPACFLVFPCLAYSSNRLIGINMQRGQFCEVKEAILF